MGSKTGIAAIAEGRTDLFRMDPRKIVIRHGWNSRDFDLPENQEHVEQLAASIREVGVREPLAGYLDDGEFVLTNGESRLRAVLSLIADGVEIKSVPVQPEPRHASEADHLASQIIRNSGKPFTPIENAKVFARLMDFGWSAKDIAAKTGITPERVAQIAKLNSVTEAVRKHIQKGEITSSLVQRIQQKAKSAAEVEEQVVAAIQAAQAEGKSKATPKHAPKTTAKKKTQKKTKTNYRELFEELVSYLGDEHDADDNGYTVTGFIPEARWDAMLAASKTQGRF